MLSEITQKHMKFTQTFSEIGIRVSRTWNCSEQWFSNGMLQEVARCAVNITIVYFNNKFWEELTVYVPWYATGHIENDTSNNSSIVECVFVTTVTFLSSRCLATITGFLPNCCPATIRKFLPSRCQATIREYRYRHTDWWEGLLNQDAEKGSGAMIYVPNFIKIGPGIQKLIRGEYTDTRTHSHTDSNVIA
jgi:hypothetical protein